MAVKVAEEFIVHVKVLDEQHAQLFDLIDRLNTATASGKGPKTGEKALAELCDYAHVHFEEEEGLMKQAGYAALSAHRVAHRDFIAKIEGWMHDAALGHTKTLAGEMSAYLTDWLRKHIRIADQQYVGILHAKGIK